MGPLSGLGDELPLVPVPVPVGLQPEGGGRSREAESAPVGDRRHKNNEASPVRGAGHVERGSPGDGRDELHGSDDGSSDWAPLLRLLERRPSVGGPVWRGLSEDQGEDFGGSVQGDRRGEAGASASESSVRTHSSRRSSRLSSSLFFPFPPTCNPKDYWKELVRAPLVLISVGTIGAYFAHPFMQAGAALSTNTGCVPGGIFS
ncbi:hypothetical protein THAOC_20690 [Thalassiosira oceanica]|uniref:Uncharacterized protein n=1 Tax=Thalassiosira oceanica TaxID=159749 RepID=K0SDU1_THAOC|nr:hypothetical protein THAOC_20690 [Thalassiosira oceanica]|eukprot:EJK59126.1 hypothetical protein THAOC_20690 [Thalassiosira oceanica]